MGTLAVLLQLQTWLCSKPDGILLVRMEKRNIYGCHVAWGEALNVTPSLDRTPPFFKNVIYKVEPQNNHNMIMTFSRRRCDNYDKKSDAMILGDR